MERTVGKDPERSPEQQRHVLFSGNPQFDVMLTDAVREQWVAAWLYLRHRTEAGDCSEEVRDAFRTLTPHLELALGGSPDERHGLLRRELRRMKKVDRATRESEAGESDA